jgi:peptide/nickel transport system substrate-binding protein
MSRMIWGVAAIAALAVSCKSSSSSSDEKSQTAKVNEGATPQPGGHIRLPSNEPRWLNPILETRFDLANTIMFEGLVSMDAHGDPTARLAKSWTVSPDGLVITFKMREKSVWHDGQAISSEDVAFTFDTVRKTQRTTLWKAYMAPVAKIETPDDMTIVVTYAQPYAPALAAWTMPILPAHIYRGEDDLAESKGNREAVGSGPFKLTRWEAGKRIVLSAHDKWWGGKPLLASVELVLGVSDGEMLGQLRRGQLDWAPIRIIDDQAELSRNPELRDEFEDQEVTEPRLRMIAWNTDKRPFDDKRVRQALTMALDRSRVIDDVLEGQAQILSGPFFPNMMGADASIAPMPFDLEKAGKLLAEAIPGKTPPAAGSAVAPGAPARRLTIDMIAVESQRNPVTDGAFAIFRRDLASIGVEVKLTILPAKEYFDKIAAREFDAAFFGWLPDIPDPDPYALLHSTQIGIGANYAGYANSDVDRLLDEARTATDSKARKALYAKIHAVLADEMPYTPLFAPYGNYAWTRRLHGVGARDLGPQPVVPGIARWWLSATAPVPPN